MKLGLGRDLMGSDALLDMQRKGGHRKNVVSWNSVIPGSLCAKTFQSYEENTKLEKEKIMANGVAISNVQPVLD